MNKDTMAVIIMLTSFYSILLKCAINNPARITKDNARGNGTIKEMRSIDKPISRTYARFIFHIPPNRCV